MSPSIAQSVLAGVPGLYDLEICTTTSYNQPSNALLTDVHGVRTIGGLYDLCSNLWVMGHLIYDGIYWPTREHAITFYKMCALTRQPREMIKIHMMELAQDNPLQVCQFAKGQLIGSYHKREDWRKLCKEQVSSIMKTAALQDYHLMRATLEPGTTDFFVPAEREDGTDADWLFPEVSLQAGLLKSLRGFLIQLATSIYKVLHQLDMGEGWPPEINPDDLPSCIYDFINKQTAFNHLTSMDFLGFTPIMKPETPENTMMIDDKQLDDQELSAAESLTQIRTPHSFRLSILGKE